MERLNQDDVQELKSLLENDTIQDVELRVIELLKKRKSLIISNNEAINRILAKPRINRVHTPFDAGYNDSGYNDVQDPQPGGGYKDYSQFIDNIINPIAGGYNDIQDPQPGGGYMDYSQHIEDNQANFSGYNDGPQDPLSLDLASPLLQNPELVNKLKENGLLSEYISFRKQLMR